jgi:hypothetical protein
VAAAHEHVWAVEPGTHVKIALSAVVPNDPVSPVSSTMSTLKLCASCSAKP